MPLVETESLLRAALDRMDISAVPIVTPTRWDVGPVAAFLFAGDPVTMIDGSLDTPDARAATEKALADHGLRAENVRRIIVTHCHSDHYRGAAWVQEASGCEVLMHGDDIALTNDPEWKRSMRELFVPLGFSEEKMREWEQEDDFDRATPSFTSVADGACFGVAGRSLRVEHRPGHTPGHVWVTDEASGAIFVGDYLIDGHPTNAGLELDRSHPTGRAPLLAQYNDGLRVLAAREAPVLLPAHGPPITHHRSLIERRLAKTDRRTRRVLAAVRDCQPATALAVAEHMYGRQRAIDSWGVIADVVGRLDLLVAERRASTTMGEDGAWLFGVPIQGEGGRHA